VGATGASADIRIQALEDKGLVRRLASPNLTALSGSTASFLAGGEFPVPVAGETNAAGVQQVTVSFKKFGVMLDFAPVVLENGAINLKITPEVSELDFTNAVRNVSVTIPAIVVRRASTEIVLRSGQSFALAGLMSNSLRNSAAQLPWIGSVPVIGALFRSQSFQKKETELVIIVTAHLAQPAVPGAQLATPLDRTLPPNDLDFFLGGKLELTKDYRYYVERGGGVQGPYGHIVDPAVDRAAAALRARN
jgi:pilus assembly protein CpaC